MTTQKDSQPNKKLKIDPTPTNTSIPKDLKLSEKPLNSIKITTWNVAGLNASLKKGFDIFVKCEDADILCIQETKLNQTPGFTIPCLKNYPFQYWNHSTAKKGYAGSAIFSKIKPISVLYGIQHKEMDDEGRVISLEFEDFWIVACYIPNAGSKLERLDYKLDYCNAMLDFIQKLEKEKPVIWTGDLNVAHKELDLSRPKSNSKTAGFTPQERDVFSKILVKTGMIDLYRHFYPTRSDQFTYYSFRFNCRSKNLGWRLDYFISSPKLMERIVSCEIQSLGILLFSYQRKHFIYSYDIVYGASDHVPITMILRQ